MASLCCPRKKSRGLGWRLSNRRGCGPRGPGALGRVRTAGPGPAPATRLLPAQVAVGRTEHVTDAAERACLVRSITFKYYPSVLNRLLVHEMKMNQGSKLQSLTPCSAPRLTPNAVSPGGAAPAPACTPESFCLFRCYRFDSHYFWKQGNCLPVALLPSAWPQGAAARRPGGSRMPSYQQLQPPAAHPAGQSGSWDTEELFQGHPGESWGTKTPEDLFPLQGETTVKCREVDENSFLKGKINRTPKALCVESRANKPNASVLRPLV